MAKAETQLINQCVMLNNHVPKNDLFRSSLLIKKGFCFIRIVLHSRLICTLCSSENIYVHILCFLYLVLDCVWLRIGKLLSCVLF